MIRPLDSSSVRQLCAGQVISTLSGALKELIENSMDAGATCVDVFLQNYGLDSIVVADNGSGISMEIDSPCVLLAQRATSKRHSLTAPPSLPTSSSSRLTTCEHIDNGGNADAKEAAAATQRSDVTVSSHDSLGFRGEALHSLAQLSDVSIETRSDISPSTFVVTFDRQTNTSSVATAESTRDKGTTVTITNLFARLPVRRQEYERQRKKQLNDAVALVKQYSLSRPDVRLILQHKLNGERDTATVTVSSTSGSGDVQRSIAEAYGGRVLAHTIHVSWMLTRCELQGYVSAVGHGRATADMQVFALDGRLVDLPRFSKAISESFHLSHPNAAQRVCPAFFLRITTNGETNYDVNLAPDKRKVLLEMEQAIADELREMATREFKSSSEAIEIKRDQQVAANAKAEERRYQVTLTPVSATSPSLLVCSAQKGPRGGNSFDAVTAVLRSPVDHTPTRMLSGRQDTLSAVMSQPGGSGATPKSRTNLSNDSSDAFGEPISCAEETPVRGTMSEAMSNECTGKDETVELGVRPREEDEAEVLRREVTDDHVDYKKQRREAVIARFPSLEELASMPLEPPTVEHHGDNAKLGKKGRAGKRAVKALAAQTGEDLHHSLNKASFTEMVIYGQFNHGFILASYHDDLFIIDQHASDEKFNYEHLMAEYAAKPQPLVRPCRVAMEAHEAELALENKAALRAHGFLVQPCDPNADDCSAGAVNVASVPVLPYDTVVPQDVTELTQQLVQYGAIVRPLRSVWHSMATKACRSSIMIGTVLSDKTMRDIVDHLSTMEQPWNCPHGRPTLRHLGTLSEYRAAADDS